MDPIADMLVIIKNGYLAQKSYITIPYSKMKLEIANVLEKEEFIGHVSRKNSNIIAELIFDGHKPRLTQVQRVSKLGLRIYTKSKKIKPVKGGRGFVIVSTSKGLMTGKEANKKNLGGEIICRVW